MACFLISLEEKEVSIYYLQHESTMQLVLYIHAKKVRKWLTFDKLILSLPIEASCCTVIEDYFIAVLY
jgi:hypothetical protein